MVAKLWIGDKKKLTLRDCDVRIANQVLERVNEAKYCRSRSPRTRTLFLLIVAVIFQVSSPQILGKLSSASSGMNFVTYFSNHLEKSRSNKKIASVQLKYEKKKLNSFSPCFEKLFTRRKMLVELFFSRIMESIVDSRSYHLFLFASATLVGAHWDVTSSRE